MYWKHHPADIMTVIPILLAENPDYAGYIIPPAPPRPDFDASREKLQKLGEAESGQLTKVHP